MQLTIAIPLAFAVSQLFFINLYLLVNHRNSKLSLLFVVLNTSLICYLVAEGLTTLGTLPTWLDWVRWSIYRVGNLSPFLIWLLAVRLFDDSPLQNKIHPAILIAAISALILRGTWGICRILEIEVGTTLFFATLIIPQIIISCFPLSAIYIAVKGYSSDLVLERRKERLVFIVSAAVLILTIWSYRGALNISLPLRERFFPSLYLVTLFISYSYFVSVFLFLWKLRAGKLSELSFEKKLQKNSRTKIIRTEDTRLMDVISNAMAADKLWRIHHLTVRMLSDHISSQEYLVRRAINNCLDFKNFSDYLNSFRLKESSEMLINSDERITDISLHVGYASTSSFYSAFKAKYGVTPKVIRDTRKTLPEDKQVQ